jgi:periplasmic divalent cation tolerance protein
VQVTPPVTSYFWWEGEVQTEGEVVLFIKTDSTLKAKIEQILDEIHPYEVPELIFIPIQDGLQAYLDWMGEELH